MIAKKKKTKASGTKKQKFAANIGPVKTNNFMDWTPPKQKETINVSDIQTANSNQHSTAIFSKDIPNSIQIS